MAFVTTLIALSVTYSAARFAAFNRGLGIAAALLSLGVGLFLAYQIGLVDGLFTADPQWSPKWRHAPGAVRPRGAARQLG